MVQPAWQKVVADVAKASAPHGLDLVHPFAVDWYNRAVASADRLDDFGEPQSLAVLLGNSRALWPVFTGAVKNDARLAEAEHPLDSYIETSVATVMASLAPIAARSYFGHVTQPTALPIQRLAELVGFAAVAPSHLAVHPVHGPWIALRAVLVLDTPGPSAEPAPPERPCPGCSKPCMAAFEHALEVSGMPLAARAIASNASAWIAVRDACPIGQASRYGQAQLDYHYTGNRAALQGS